MAIAEKFFVETTGVSLFLHMDNLAAKDTEGANSRTTSSVPQLRRAGCSTALMRTIQFGRDGSPLARRLLLTRR
jgi:hypothetical protein